MAPPRISGYAIEKLLGRGGFASVYLATRDETGEQVALKVLYEHTTEDADIKRFERERMSLAALTGHPHIVDIVDFGETFDGHHYIALEYVEGGSIADRLRTTGAMHWADATRVGVHICSALGAAHRAGVLHRDVKPANILYGPAGAKLGDFGIARLVGQSQLTAAQSIIGTLAYTPPEVLHNHSFDGRGDIYQLGITLYEMLLGRAPFKSGSSDNKAIVIRRILDNAAPPLAQFDIPQPISDLLDQVLAKDPADRPQTADTFARELNDAEIMLGQIPSAVGTETETLFRPSVNPGGSRIPEGSAEPRVESRTPAAPDISEPMSDRTIAESARAGSTNLLPSADGIPVRPGGAAVWPRADAEQSVAAAASPPEALSVPARERPLSSGTDKTVRPPPHRPERPAEPTSRRTGLLIGTLAVLTIAIVGGIAAIQVLGDDSTGDGGPGTSIPVNGDPTDDLEIKRTIEEMVQPAFVQPGSPQGVIFGAVSNASGLTAVGAHGEGDSAASQNAAIWTMAADETWDYRVQFPKADGASIAQQRIWSIGVLDGENFLAVGETAGGDGTAWIGLLVDDMVPLTDGTFTGPGRQRFRGSTGDPGRKEFLVAGAHSNGGPETPGLWMVRPEPGEPEPSWEDPSWTLIPIRGQRSGELTDVAIAGDEAVAVGWERASDGTPQGLVMIRDNDAPEPDTWVNLLEPIANTELNAVDFFGDRIVAVGTRTVLGVSRPLAVVVDTTGIGLVHELPMAGNKSGKANDVVETEAGVFAVGLTGEVDGDKAFEDRLTDGALWEFVPGGEPSGDRWQTRDTDKLDEPGYQEFWSVVEYRGRVFALGRKDGENDGETVAAAWTVTVDFGEDDSPSEQVVEAQSDAAPDTLPASIIDGDPALGLAPGGCAAQAVADVRDRTGSQTMNLEPVLQSATERFAIWICEDDASNLWYHGARRDSDPPVSITIAASVGADGAGYVARNPDQDGPGFTEYRVADGKLTVRTSGGTLIIDEALINR